LKEDKCKGAIGTTERNRAAREGGGVRKMAAVEELSYKHLLETQNGGRIKDFGKALKAKIEGKRASPSGDARD